MSTAETYRPDNSDVETHPDDLVARLELLSDDAPVGGMKRPEAGQVEDSNVLIFPIRPGSKKFDIGQEPFHEEPDQAREFTDEELADFAAADSKLSLEEAGEQLERLINKTRDDIAREAIRQSLFLSPRTTRANEEMDKKSRLAFEKLEAEKEQAAKKAAKVAVIEAGQAAHQADLEREGRDKDMLNFRPGHTKRQLTKPAVKNNPKSVASRRRQVVNNRRDGKARERKHHA